MSNNSRKRREALVYHAKPKPGKIQIVPTKKYASQRDLSLAYSPGVAEPCLEIEKDKENAYKYTTKGNLVAVISNGTAVLGLGDIGPEASKPVMEGKGLLFKIFADIDVFDIEVDTKNVEVVIKTFKGKLIDTLELVCKSLDIDLILLEPRTNSIKDEVYLGKTSGKIIKQTNIPALIVPEGFKYKPINSILMALKSATIKKEGVLNPLKAIKTQYKSVLNLLLVKTPFYNEGDFDVTEELKLLVDSTSTSENATTFQGVLENYKDNNPDLLCVVRRKRGFFTKLWEKNSILKKDFHSSTLPVLVLSGIK